MTPYELLGVSNRATMEEISFAYKTAAQIFHPDRFVGAPDAVRAEAERRMKELSEAYNKIRRDPRGIARKTRVDEARGRRRVVADSAYVPRQPKVVSWEQAARDRVAAARKAAEDRATREAAAVHGTARPRPKPRFTEQSILYGLGEALVTDRLPCSGCRSILHLPAGWRDSLLDTNFFCSVCDRKVLCR